MKTGTSDKQRQAQATLPASLHQTFSELIDDYKTACEAHVAGGRVFVNYNILADLIRNGWRKVS
jgi:hypothetical protein